MNHSPNNDDKIPRWFYNMVISMGVMVFIAFGLIFFVIKTIIKFLHNIPKKINPKAMNTMTPMLITIL